MTELSEVINHLLDCVWPKWERENLHSTILMQRIIEISEFREQLCQLKTNIIAKIRASENRNEIIRFVQEEINAAKDILKDKTNEYEEELEKIESSSDSD